MKKVWIIISLAILILLLLFFWRKSCRYGEGMNEKSENIELIKFPTFNTDGLWKKPTDISLSIPTETSSSGSGIEKIGWKHDNAIIAYNSKAKIDGIPTSEQPCILLKDTEKIEQTFDIDISKGGKYTLEITACGDASNNTINVDISSNGDVGTFIKFPLKKQWETRTTTFIFDVGSEDITSETLSIYGTSKGKFAIQKVSLQKKEYTIEDVKNGITTSSDKITNNIQKSSDKIINDIINRIDSSTKDEISKIDEMKKLITQMSNSANRNNEFAANIHRNF
jgi:hypothetical protein